VYKIADEKLDFKPELRLGDRIYSIDNRLSVFRRITQELSGTEGEEADEFSVVLGHALGESAYSEILALDLPFSVMQEMVVIVLAAIQDLPLEEARRRFRGV